MMSCVSQGWRGRGDGVGVQGASPVETPRARRCGGRIARVGVDVELYENGRRLAAGKLGTEFVVQYRPWLRGGEHVITDVVHIGMFAIG